ncbi:hypothetical protein ABIB15_001400 [Marisediminicola sp. UYEF4]|uniref:hypothetical protein n=1 Tax=Marisediminicola sp. UYEF4 TaxID=1756384 RepID=UPI0033995A2E
MSAVELPTWRGAPDDAVRARAAIDRWAGSLAMARLVESFGGTTGDHEGRELLDYLDTFSAAHWDFRRGRERNLAPDAGLSTTQSALVVEEVPRLGLAGIERPTRPHYDTVLLTGGMVRAGIVKPRFVARLVEGGLSVSNIVFLGGFRSFGGDEHALAAALGVVGGDEVFAMLAGMRQAFGPLGDPVVDRSVAAKPHASWCEYSWSAGGVRLSVVAAPSSEPWARRANTADTFRFWAAHRRSPTERSVLVVTTPIYVPYQAAGAVELLGVDHGLAVETIGVDAVASDLGALTQQFLPQHHLQELRSAIRAMRALRARVALPGEHPSAG